MARIPKEYLLDPSPKTVARVALLSEAAAYDNRI
jgi:hypothetical protein